MPANKSIELPEVAGIKPRGAKSRQQARFNQAVKGLFQDAVQACFAEDLVDEFYRPERPRWRGPSWPAPGSPQQKKLEDQRKEYDELMGQFEGHQEEICLRLMQLVGHEVMVKIDEAVAKLDKKQAKKQAKKPEKKEEPVGPTA